MSKTSNAQITSKLPFNQFYIEKGVAYLEPKPEYNEKFKRSGFAWCKSRKAWMTTHHKVLAKVPHITTNLEGLSKRNVALSRATHSKISVPVPSNCKFLPFQLAGIEFMQGKEGVLVADQMGLGKTVEAIGFANTLPLDSIKVLIVCPASLKRNWASEWKKWSVHTGLSVGLAEGKAFPNTDVVIINYDILKKHREEIRARQWTLVILDECHYLKNNKAQRTQEICGYRTLKPLAAEYKLALTGTPVVNRPIDLFNVLKYLSPAGFHNKFGYAKRYCDAQQTRFGWDMSGASNLDELQEKLRSTIMLRREKAAVLTSLPPKRRQIIELEEDLTVKKAERKIWHDLLFHLGMSREEVNQEENYEAVVKALKHDSIPFEQISNIRRLTGIAKLPFIISHLRDCLEQEDKVVVFCHHREVAHEIYKNFKELACVVHGRTTLVDRHQAVLDFQNTVSPTKILIGNIQAAGVGLTLTASSLVVFAELDWVPGNVSQAEDRCHRIGQEDNVLVQHIVLENSIDALMCKAIVRKQEIIDKLLG